MSSPCRSGAALVLALAAAVAAAQPAAPAPPASAADAMPTALRACVDPDNLPYAHADGSGYEPALARLLADALALPLELHWQPMRRGIVRKTLGDRVCDVLLSVPRGLDRVLTTRPYYRSSYVAVVRADDPAPLRSLQDPRLPALRVGVQLIGDDLAASPPAHALVRRGAVEHVVGFTVDGGSEDGGPQRSGAAPAAQRMVDAVARDELDAALVWGPQAGWYAARARTPLAVTPLTAPPDLGMPFEFGIALAVRRGEAAWRDRLQSALDARRGEIDALLARWQVPRGEGGAR